MNDRMNEWGKATLFNFLASGEYFHINYLVYFIFYSIIFLNFRH